MPKNKKEASSSDSDSGPEDRTPAPKKTKVDEKKQSSSSGNDSNVEWHLDGKRYVKINEFRGRQMVDIREYYEKDGELLPGKKGISLTPLQWKKLLGLGDEINKQLN